MKPAVDPPANPRIYLVPKSQRDLPARTTEHGLGPDSAPAMRVAPADGSSELPYPLVRTKLPAEVERAPANAVTVEPGTSFEHAAEELIEAPDSTGFYEPGMPTPPIIPNAAFPPVAMTSPVPFIPPVPLATFEPAARRDEASEPEGPREPTPLRARVAHWAAFLMLACVIGVGVLALDRTLLPRNASEPPATVPPRAMSISAAVPEPQQPTEPPVQAPAAALPVLAAPAAIPAPPVAPTADPRVLPPRRASKAAAAAATAKADWTSAPPPESVQAFNETNAASASDSPSVTASATLSINSIPISNVSVDGQPFGSTPRKVNVPPGKHSVVFTHPELGAKTVTVEVPAGGSTVAAVKF